MHAALLSFDVDVFKRLLFSTEFLRGVWTTFWVTVAAMLIGMALGLLGALGRNSRLAPLRWLVLAYLWVFRGTPVLVQIIFWYDATAELTNNLINLPELVAGLMALGINEGAYMTEIVRAGLLSVESGQAEASRSLGMTYRQTMRHIVIPQALRVIIPPTGNEFISMLKTTSLLFVAAVPELYSIGEGEYSQNFRYLEVLAVVSIWYLFLTSIFSTVQGQLERRYGYARMNVGRAGGGIFNRWFGFGAPRGAR
jgi:polar amino acid transport system permease protein